jgi:hypothetical protein
MTKKILAGSITGSITGFLLGWVLFGMLMHSFYQSGTVYYEGLMKTSPDLVPIFVGNLSLSVLLAVLLDKMNVTDPKGGAIWGGLIFAFMMFGMNSFFHGTMNLYKPMTLVVDVIVNTIFGAILGAVIAFVMSKVP